MHATLPLLKNSDFPPLSRTRLTTLQVNLGYRCNQSCFHCHVNAGPKREEQMDRETAELVLQILRRQQLDCLDLTGGAPELNSHFRHLVEAANTMGIRVIDRCNLTILQEPGQEDLAWFLATQGVEINASLPCYLPQNVDAQRGKGVYENSLTGLRRLNDQGYGQKGSDLILNLVYNPAGTHLPPPQQLLEQDYRKRLGELGIVFNRLLTITNMPIKRFGSTLISKGLFHDYMQSLRAAHLESNLEGVMCRSLVSVDWQGYLYDCDFNQMLDMHLPLAGKGRPHLRELLSQNLEGLRIAVADHCYGCTAGQGSSCGGALEA